MIFFEHRRNKISDLDHVHLENGVEIDLRSKVDEPGVIHLSHDPWLKGDDFEQWLLKYKDRGIKGTIILNTKEDALEERAIEIINKVGIEKYIFLDTTFPTFIRWSNRGRAENFFLRLSKYEDLTNILKFQGRVSWLWCDCFDHEIVDENVLREASLYFKLCMVSPELQGGDEATFSHFLPYSKYFDAICTKNSKKWREIIGGI